VCMYVCMYVSLGIRSRLRNGNGELYIPYIEQGALRLASSSSIFPAKKNSSNQFNNSTFYTYPIPHHTMQDALLHPPPRDCRNQPRLLRPGEFLLGQKLQKLHWRASSRSYATTFHWPFASARALLRKGTLAVGIGKREFVRVK